VVWSATGDVTTGTNYLPSFIVPFACTISKAYLYARTAPTGAALIVDINKDGTSIWSATQANRVQLAATANTGDQTSFDTTSLVENSRLDVDIDQIGSTIAGSNITIELRLQV
jgi:hypothetical protein